VAQDFCRVAQDFCRMAENIRCITVTNCCGPQTASEAMEDIYEVAHSFNRTPQGTFPP
jgi:hypothetical protein